jgi:hypothetical protein
MRGDFEQKIGKNKMGAKWGQNDLCSGKNSRLNSGQKVTTKRSSF